MFKKSKKRSRPRAMKGGIPVRWRVISVHRKKTKHHSKTGKR